LRGGSQPSVSYVNALLIDQKLFVPAIGLRRFEERTFSQLRRDLEGRYQVIPVDARTEVTRAGGVHRAFGIFRQSAPFVPIITQGGR
jgi:agmatine/peptidylarginine deiminase